MIIYDIESYVHEYTQRNNDMPKMDFNFVDKELYGYFTGYVVFPIVRYEKHYMTIKPIEFDTLKELKDFLKERIKTHKIFLYYLTEKKKLFSVGYKIRMCEIERDLVY